MSTTIQAPAITGREAPPSRTKTSGSMRAIVQRNYGSAESLELAELARPKIGPEEVLVEVHAAGVDRGVWHLMTGLPYLVRLAGYGITKPKSLVPGLDVSGRVVEVGDDVERFGVGDEVFGIARGSYAEFAVADEVKLAQKPGNITFEQAAVAAISGITALQALADVAKIEPGQSVLVIGASGGVGTYAVQIAKALGGRVTGVARGAKTEMVSSLGADSVIDYTKTDYLDGQIRYDVIIDTGGLNSVRSLRKALNHDGRLVIVGGEGGGRWTGGSGRQLRAMALSPFVSQRLTTLISEEHHTHIERLASLIESGDVVPAVGRRFELAETVDAISALEAGAIAGKAVVVVGVVGDGS